MRCRRPLSTQPAHRGSRESTAGTSGDHDRVPKLRQRQRQRTRRGQPGQALISHTSFKEGPSLRTRSDPVFTRPALAAGLLACVCLLLVPVAFAGAVGALFCFRRPSLLDELRDQRDRRNDRPGQPQRISGHPAPDQGRERPRRRRRSRRLRLLVESGNRRQQPRHHDRPCEARRYARQSELHHRAEQPAQPRDQRQLPLLGQPLRQHDRPGQARRHPGQLAASSAARSDRGASRSRASTSTGRTTAQTAAATERRSARANLERPRRQPELHHRRSRPGRNRRPRHATSTGRTRAATNPARRSAAPISTAAARTRASSAAPTHPQAHRQRHPHLLGELRRPARHTRHNDRPRKPQRHRRQPTLHQRSLQPRRAHRGLTGRTPPRGSAACDERREPNGGSQPRASAAQEANNLIPRIAD